MMSYCSRKMKKNCYRQLMDSSPSARKTFFPPTPKTSLYKKDVTVCGRIIREEGVPFHTHNFVEVGAMKKSQFGNEVDQLLCAAT